MTTARDPAGEIQMVELFALRDDWQEEPPGGPGVFSAALVLADDEVVHLIVPGCEAESFILKRNGSNESSHSGRIDLAPLGGEDPIPIMLANDGTTPVLTAGPSKTPFVLIPGGVFAAVAARCKAGCHPEKKLIGCRPLYVGAQVARDLLNQYDWHGVGWSAARWDECQGALETALDLAAKALRKHEERFFFILRQIMQELEIASRRPARVRCIGGTAGVGAMVPIGDDENE